MKGWRIFLHSARLVLNNLDDALRISAVLYAVQSLVPLTTYLFPPETVVEDGVTIPVLTLPHALLNLGVGLVAIVASLWIAVAWHRYVLADEKPAGWLPDWQGPRLLGYLGRTVLIALVVSAAVMAGSLVVGLIGTVMPVLVPVLMLALVALAGYVFFRFGVILPSGTIDRPLTLREAFDVTSDESAALVPLSLLTIGLALIVHVPTLVSGDPSSALSLVYSIVVNWFVTMIGISVLTTLYGHYVQKRPIT